MGNLSRRDLIKGGIAIAGVTPATPQTAQNNSSAVPGDPKITNGRERLLLDFGWRFHLGNADKQTDDMNLGTSGQTFAKSGNLVRAAAANFDDSSWQKV